MIEVTIRSKYAFGVVLYFATCPICMCWIKSVTGQYVWEHRSSVRQQAKAHVLKHQA